MRAEDLYGSVSMYNMASLSGKRHRNHSRIEKRHGRGVCSFVRSFYVRLLSSRRRKKSSGRSSQKPPPPHTHARLSAPPTTASRFSRSRCHLAAADTIIPSGCGLSHVSDGSYSTHRPISNVLRGVMSCHNCRSCCPFQRLSFLVCHPALSFFIPAPPFPFF